MHTGLTMQQLVLQESALQKCPCLQAACWHDTWFNTCMMDLEQPASLMPSSARIASRSLLASMASHGSQWQLAAGIRINTVDNRIRDVRDYCQHQTCCSDAPPARCDDRQLTVEEAQLEGSWAEARSYPRSCVGQSLAGKGPWQRALDRASSAFQPSPRLVGRSELQV